MNKRIQKKVAKRLAQEQEMAGLAEVSAKPTASARKPARSSGRGAQAAAGRRLHAVKSVAEQARAPQTQGAVGAVMAVAEQVQERTTEAISQVKDKIAETQQSAEALYREKETQLKEKLAETEERAEALLEKVPLVGAAAARKLHDLTHR